MQNMYFFYLFSFVGQWALFTRLGVMCYPLPRICTPLQGSSRRAKHLHIQGSWSRWLKPELAQARFWKSWNVEIQNFGIQHNLKKENSQNLDLRSSKCWQGLDCSKKTKQKKTPGQFGAIPGNVFHGRTKKMFEFCLFSLLGQWALFTQFGVPFPGLEKAKV